MKYSTLLLALITTLLVSCSSLDDKIQLQSEVNQLQYEINQMKHRQQQLTEQQEQLLEQRHLIYQDITTLQSCKNQNRQPVYLVTVRIKQSTLTLDIGEHIKNSANAFEMTFPTTKEFYDQCHLNQDISKSFKKGSFFINGDISNLHITCVKKEIK